MSFLATKCKNIIVNDMANFSAMPTKPNKCASAEAASRDQGGAATPIVGNMTTTYVFEGTHAVQMGGSQRCKVVAKNPAISGGKHSSVPVPLEF